MPPDDHERRSECRDDFKRQDRAIENITKPGGTIATIHKKIEDFKACLQREINIKIGSKMFITIVGSLAVLIIGGLSASFTYTYGIDKATAGLVTKQELKEEIEESEEYLKEKIENLGDSVDKLIIRNAKDKQEILDAIRNQ